MSRSNHWMWQPRSTNGRFASSGGGEDLPTWPILVGWFVAAWWLMGWSGVVSLALGLAVVVGAIWIIRRYV